MKEMAEMNFLKLAQVIELCMVKLMIKFSDQSKLNATKCSNLIAACASRSYNAKQTIGRSTRLIIGRCCYLRWSFC